MASRDLAVTLYIPCCPEMEFREGMFHVMFDAGERARFEVVMSPNTFLTSVRMASKIAAEFHAGERTILKFKDPKATDSGIGH